MMRVKNGSPGCRKASSDANSHSIDVSTICCCRLQTAAAGSCNLLPAVGDSCCLPEIKDSLRATDVQPASVSTQPMLQDGKLQAAASSMLHKTVHVTNDFSSQPP